MLSSDQVPPLLACDRACLRLQQVRATMAQDRQRLRDVFREMVFKTAPGARA